MHRKIDILNRNRLKKDMMQVIWGINPNFHLMLRGRKGIIQHYFSKSIALRREV